jgi:CheY-like chemotaxis protein
MNNVSNALKFTEPGKIKIDIGIEEINIPEGDKIKLRFNVADTGIGIPIEKQQHIFDLFTQVDSSKTRKHGGSGLGLAITSQLAILLGGNTGVVSPGSLCSNENPGADFWFTMSVKRSVKPKLENDKVDNTSAKFSRRMKSLVAEDNLVNQLLIKKVLDNMNCDAVVVENGLLAVEEIARARYDFVLMDIQMPVMDGYQATMVIRQTKNASIPILGVSANVYKEDIEKSFNAGMDAHISKPFNPVDLYNSIQNILKSRVC